MGIWIALAAVVLVAVVVVVVRRPRPRRHHGPAVRTTAQPLRVSWPPGYSATRPIRTVEKPDALFLIEAFDTRDAALAFLRGCEIRDRGIYVVAENPQGNLGKDLIMVFEEADGTLVELAERSPLPAPRRSADDCARCGYYVFPATVPGVSVSSGGTTRWYVALDELELKGHGYRCRSCGALACASCYRSSPRKPDEKGRILTRCWVCDGQTEVLTR